MKARTPARRIRRCREGLKPPAGCDDTVKNLAGSFLDAGKALVKALADGIAAGAGAAIKAMKDVAGQLRDLLPGSEPKDSRSPLRGLQNAGRAVLGNLAGDIAGVGWWPSRSRSSSRHR